MPQTKRVVLFSTPSCGWCVKAKQYFIKKQIKFKEVDVSKDQRAARDMVKMTGQTGVPVVLIGSRPIVGFDQRKIEKLLGLN